jgi:hypothetical protein
MIEQYLSNTNKSAAIPILQKKNGSKQGVSIYLFARNHL